MKTNFHTHTYRCNHAVGEEKDYVLGAIEKKLDILGFSDHGPFKDEIFDTRMPFSDLDDYLFKIENLKSKYKDKICIKSGLEMEFFPEKSKQYEELLTKNNVEYLVLGQHFFKDNNSFIDTYILNDTSQYLKYAEISIEGMKTGYFKFLAHPDVVFVNDFKWDKNCDKFCDLIINAALKYNLILEYNANGIRKGKRKFCDGTRFAYPDERFWKKIAKENIKVIINSDCHNPEHIWDNTMDKSFEMAKDLNLNLIYNIF